MNTENIQELMNNGIEVISNKGLMPYVIGGGIIALMVFYSHLRDKARASKLLRLKKKIERLEFKR